MGFIWGRADDALCGCRITEQQTYIKIIATHCRRVPCSTLKTGKNLILHTAVADGGMLIPVIFKHVGDARPYPPHGLTTKQWVQIEPQEIRFDQLVTTKSTLDLHTLLSEDSTLFGDLFPHVVAWCGDLYLEDGLQRTLRAALHGRETIHARVLDLASSEIQ